MATAALPDNETMRLALLQTLNIVDTPIEERFERITRLLTRVLNTPMSALTFVEADRHWAKSLQGSDRVEVPREHSFCAHTILEDSVLVVNDTRADERFADNPLVTGTSGIRFYAGVPLTLAENVRVGALCVYDTEPRELDEDDRELLQDFAETVASELRARLMQHLYQGVA